MEELGLTFRKCPCCGKHPDVGWYSIELVLHDCESKLVLSDHYNNHAQAGWEERDLSEQITQGMVSGMQFVWDALCQARERTLM